MAYIANKPVRFDRNYAIGEAIPDGVVAPKMAKKLVELGKIAITGANDPPKEKSGGGAEFKAHLTPEQFNDWTVEQLTRFAADLGVAVSGDARQEDLIALITAIDFEPDAIGGIDLDQYAQADDMDMDGNEQDPAQNDATGGDGGESGDGQPNPQEGGENAPEGQETPNNESADEQPATSEFVCDICGKVLTSKATLTNHKKTHKTE